MHRYIERSRADARISYWPESTVAAAAQCGFLLSRGSAGPPMAQPTIQSLVPVEPSELDERAAQLGLVVAGGRVLVAVVLEALDELADFSGCLGCLPLHGR